MTQDFLSQDDQLRCETCTCEDFGLTQKPCKHIYAVRFVVERDFGGKPPALDTSAVPKRPTYKQDWPKYNEAQTTEKNRFQELLFDLCQGLPEPPYAGNGRPPTTLSDKAFACAFKVYSLLSARRFTCDLNEAHARGYLSKPLHYNKVLAFLEDAALTPILYRLIVRASLPLRAVETTFAVDSSGFSTSRFQRWYDHKYGRTRQEHDWVKCHVACGTKTHIITAITIAGRDANDSPQLPLLVKATAENFQIEEVSGDKAYISIENLQTVVDCGGTPFIAFKTSATPNRGGLWERMLSYYTFRREEFLTHYHRRSNVESVFSMLKRKFGDHIRSRTDTAMVNETLCKVLCHNVCVLIASNCELGIEPVFWPEQKEEAPAILRMNRLGR